jgi:ABC-type multidrug transport system ATPase subunit
MELIARQVGCCYAGLEALAGVDLSLRPGTVHAVIGPNGSGKSTLLSIMSGLRRPTSGSVAIRDGGVESPVRGPLEGLGMTFQPVALWEHLSVERHLKLVLSGSAVRRGDWHGRIEQVLESCRLSHLRRKKPPQLSAGQRQWLSLARALAGRPRWLLLDEPLAHLDCEARRRALGLIGDACRQFPAGVLIAAHPHDDALALAGSVTHLLEGRPVAAEPTNSAGTPFVYSCLR